jgi:tRNA(His) guanylyltransferase
MWKVVGDRIKELERAQERKVPADQCFVVRLDGCCFSTFTRGLERPFDARFVDTMEKTTADLVSKYNARIGFTQSDEISLLFDKCNEDQQQQVHMYSGRVQKLCSILAAYTSVRFNHHLHLHHWDNRMQSKLEAGAVFDARVICPTSQAEALECFSWRHQSECRRNAIMSIAQHNFSAKALHGVSTRNAVRKLEDEKGVELHLYPDNYLYGTFVKRILVKKLCTDHVTGEAVECVRTDTVNIVQQEALTTEVLFSKYANAQATKVTL